MFGRTLSRSALAGNLLFAAVSVMMAFVPCGIGLTRAEASTALPPQISSVSPTAWPKGDWSGLRIQGHDFMAPDSVWLQRSEFSRLSAQVLSVASGEIRCRLDLRTAALGPWSVVVKNSDGQQGILPEGFIVSAEVPWTTETCLTCTPAHSNRAATVADGQGTVHLVWYDARDGQLYAQRYTDEVWSAEERITTEAVQPYPAVAAGLDGTVHVAWIDSRSGSPQLYTMSRVGGSWTPEEQITFPPAIVLSAAIAVNATGQKHVAWEDDREGADSEIYCKHSLTSSWTVEERLSDNATDSHTPTIAADTQGRVHVIWADHDLYYDVLLTRNWIEGTWSAEQVLVGFEAYVSCRAPSLAAGPEGSLTLVWIWHGDAGPAPST